MTDTASFPIRFDADGLIPVTIQDAATKDVLMVAFMNAEAFAATRRTGRTHFWSRGRGKLWKKGETSGHEQLVDEIFINCEQNSLLITVRQLGAACHDGYPTCYYRRLEPDDELTVVRDRRFDPADVYERADGESLESRTRRWYGAYEYLLDHDLSDVSGTAKRLRDPNAQLHNRIADELAELAGVLTGDHVHANRERDLLLEGSQSLYWIALLAVKAGVTWSALRPDRALVTAEEDFSAASAARVLLGEADAWSHGPGDPATMAVRCHAAMALVAQACRSGGVSPIALIRQDLADLESKAYLSRYFASRRASQ